ncbi:MAG: histidine triad protein [Verrucomicrobiaceae bacterium]|nr:histidine triad protein [Verrucomicrobiaceae bacterium]
MTQCLFCSIVSKQIPATILYEDDSVVAFRDIGPQAPVHFLVIPKRHLTTLNDLVVGDEHLIGHMVLTAQQLAAKEGISESGFRLAMNCNREGGQTVYHIHLHVLGGRGMSWPPG